MKKITLFRALAAIICIATAILLTPLITAVSIESVTVSNPAQTPAQNNYAPIAENLSYSTYRNVSINGNFQAVDPEGDILSFRIVAQPKKGSVTISESGFLYAPNENKKGKDSFTYVAIDSVGNVSAEARVDIVIEKQSTKISYADMSGDKSHYAALRLAEKGVFIGEQINGLYYFNPGETVSRGEFLAMCVSISGMSPLNDIKKTGFADDEDMPLWLKPYVSTALLSGVISGYTTPSGAVVFNASSSITHAEAAVMLNNVLNISNVRASAADVDMLPAWAVQAVSNLSACRIIPDISLISNHALTRAQAAEILSPALDLINARSSSNSLLSWAW